MRKGRLSALRAVCLILCLHLGLWVFIGFLQGASTRSVSSTLRNETLDALVILLVVVFCKKIYLITFEEMGMKYPRPGSKVWLCLLIGGLLWVVVDSVSDAIDQLVPASLSVPMEYDFSAIYAHSRGFSRVGLFFVLGFVTPAVEEIFFRGLIYAALKRGFSPIGSLILSSGIFGLWHVYPSLIVAAVLIGCGLTWLREYESSLLGPIMAHTTINCLSLIFVGTR